MGGRGSSSGGAARATGPTIRDSLGRTGTVVGVYRSGGRPRAFYKVADGRGARDITEAEFASYRDAGAPVVNGAGNKIRPSRVEVVTDPFEFAHGRKPSGYAGGWAFGPERMTDLDRIFWAPAGTYSQAKKAAREWAASNGYERIYAQS